MGTRHQRLTWILRLMLAAFAFGLTLPIGTGQGPQIINRPPVTLGAPIDVPAPRPVVLHFTPTIPPAPSVLLFSAVEPLLPRIASVPNRHVTAEESSEPPLFTRPDPQGRPQPPPILTKAAAPASDPGLPPLASFGTATVVEPLPPADLSGLIGEPLALPALTIAPSFELAITRDTGGVNLAQFAEPVMEEENEVRHFDAAIRPIQMLEDSRNIDQGIGMPPLVRPVPRKISVPAPIPPPPPSVRILPSAFSLIVDTVTWPLRRVQQMRPAVEPAANVQSPRYRFLGH